MTEQPPPSLSFYWHPRERRLSSGDQILVVTDIYTYSEGLYPSSSEQTWFRVGALDLRDNSLGFWRFTLDDAKGLLKVGFQPPPWGAPQPFGVRIKRDCHVSGNRMGRFRVSVTPVFVDAAILAKVPAMRKEFQRRGHRPNIAFGAWRELAARVAVEIRIEQAALGMVGSFAARDVRKATGASAADVTSALKRLVQEGKLAPSGKKRGTRYEIPPAPIATRLDWVG
jgi:hypothetical protein